MVGYPLDGPLLEVLLPILAKKNFPLAFGRDLTTHFSRKNFPLAFGRDLTTHFSRKKFPLVFGRDLTTHFSKKIFHWSLVGILLPILAKKFSTGLW